MVGFDTLFQRLIYPKFSIDSMSIEMIFEGILSGLNSEIKLSFLKYCLLKLKTKEIETWDTLMLEHFFFASIGRKKSFLYKVEGGVKYDTINELVDTLMIARKYELSLIIKNLPSLIEMEELNIYSQKKLNPNKRGSKYTFHIDSNKIDLNLLFDKLKAENYIPQNTSLTDFANIFNQSNSSNVRPITWLGKKYHLLGIFRILLDKRILIRDSHSVTDKIKLYFVDKNGMPFNTKSWPSEFSRIFNSATEKNKVDIKAISTKSENKLRYIVDTSSITPK